MHASLSKYKRKLEVGEEGQGATGHSTDNFTFQLRATHKGNRKIINDWFLIIF
jgi:hypothetical protein